MKEVKYSKQQIAYLAGIFDGEGTIQIACLRRKNTPDYHTPQAFVSNSNLKLLNWIRKIFGGSIAIGRSRNINRNWKPVHKIHFYNSIAPTIIKLIYPYLIIKKEHADIFLKFQSRLRRTHRLSKKERQFRKALYIKLRKLNNRGVKVLIA